jgi:osmotically-inducible protein OsmY
MMRHPYKQVRSLACFSAVVALVAASSLAQNEASAREQKKSTELVSKREHDKSHERSPSDLAIKNVVERELEHDSAVPDHMLDIWVEKGIVTLSGSTSSLIAKERAVQVTETVRGVRSIIDKIVVSSTGLRDDSAIRRDVNAAFFEDTATDSYEIDVSVEEGMVRLEGNVDSWAERELAAKVAKGVRGVTGLQNKLQVEMKTVRPDPEIEAEIIDSLRWNTLVDDALINVAVKNGHVELTGAVGSLAEKRRARYEAWVHGVRSVKVAKLDVLSSLENGELRAAKYVDLEDGQIEEAINAAHLRDPRVWAFKIQVDVHMGVATLRGTVDNLKAKRAAASDARNTVGVLKVENRTQVRPEDPRTDDDVADDIRATLKRDPFVERHETVVGFDEGSCYLYGTVDSWSQWRSARENAYEGGAVIVRNELEVQSEDSADSKQDEQ